MISEYLRKGGVFCIYCLIVFVFCFAVLVSLARLVNPIAQKLSEDFTETLEQTLSVPVSFQKFEISWQFTNPIIWFDQVKVGDKENQLKAERLVAKVDLLSSLFKQELVFEQIILHGALLKLKIAEKKDKTDIQQPPEILFNSSSGDSATNPSKHWLTQVAKLHLRNSIIELQHHNKISIFKGIDVDVINSGKSHKVKLDVLLPKHIGSKLRIVMDAVGDETSTRRWGGGLYIEAGEISLTWFGQEFPEIPISKLAGKSSFKVWSKWESGKIVKAHIKTDIEKAQAKLAGYPLIEVDNLNTEFWLSKNDSIWQFRTNNINYQHAQDNWQSGEVFAELLEQKKIAAYVENINLVVVKNIVDKLQLKDISLPNITGNLKNVYLIVDKYQSTPNIMFSSALKNVDLAKYKQNPGISNYSGTMAFKEKKLMLLSDAKNLVFDSNGIFREPLAIEKLKGLVEIDLNDDVKIKSDSIYIKTADVDANLRLDIVQKENEEAEVDIGLVLADADVENISAYLPQSIMSKDLIGWLDNSIKGGKVPAMTMLLKGNMTDFPFNNKKGVFDIGFNTQDLILKYQAAWPQLQNMNTDIRFYTSSMEINSKKVFMNNLGFNKLSANIANLYQPELKIVGSGYGDFDLYKKFIAKSPLKTTLGVFSNHFDFAGKAKIELDMVFDIDKGRDPKINGKLLLEHAAINNKKIGLALTNINGDIAFTESDLLATDINLQFEQQPWKLKAYTRKDIHGKATATRVYLSGKVKTQNLTKHIGKEGDFKISGKSYWKVNVDIPTVKDTQTPKVTISLDSSLVGTTFEYPAPLNKTKYSKLPTSIKINLPADNAVAKTTLKIDELIAVKQKWNTEKEWQLIASKTTIGKGDLPMVEGRANHHLLLNLQDVNIDDWLKEMSGENSKSSPGLTGLFNQAEIKLKNSIYNGRLINNFNVDFIETPNVFRYDVKSDFVKGVMNIPKGKGKTQKATLDYFKLDYLRTKNSKQKTKLKISDVPSINLNISKLFIKNILLNNVNLKVQNKGSTLKIEKMAFKNPHFDFNATGRWWGKAGRDQTNIMFDVKTDDLGKALAAFDFKDTFEDGKGTFGGDLSWPGSLMDADLTKLDGDFKISLKDGRLKKVNAGVGRVFGLFSLQALPSRLLLDFRDVVGKGFTYDSIKGDFKIVEGNAFTHNLTMESSIGLAKVNGRTGLVQKDYDQVMSFTPSLLTNLPLLGALAISPQAGITIALVNALLKTVGTDIASAGALKYKLTGSWDKPVMKLQAGVATQKNEENF